MRPILRSGAALDLVENVQLIGRVVNPRVSVVIPTLNEAMNLPHVLARIPPTVFEVILVDGGSTDGTQEVARRQWPDAVILSHPCSGKGNALATGFSACKGDIIVTLDADGSADPTEIPRFVSALTDGSDYAKGTRFAKGGGSADITRIRRLGNRVLLALTNRLYRTAYTDLCYGMNAFWRHCLSQMPLDRDGFEIETLIAIRLATSRLAVREVGSFEYSRIYGASNLRTVRDGFRVLRTIVGQRRTARSPVVRAPAGLTVEVRGATVPHGRLAARSHWSAAPDRPNLAIARGDTVPRTQGRPSAVPGWPPSSEALPRPWLDVAIVNNMPDGAFLDTESQFLKLLEAALPITPVRVHRFAMHGIRRGPEVRRRIQQAYEGLPALWSTPIDAVIITGTEPQTRRLTDERYWGELSDLISWAAESTFSAVLSCLAAHAAVLKFDGIERVPLPLKHSGVFTNQVRRSHRLTDDIPDVVAVPHSRINDIPAGLLEGRGYLPLIQAPDSWSSMVTTRGRCLFVLNQGHPEYAPLSLLREYRRDLRRHLEGRVAARPALPDGYLDSAGVAILSEFEESISRRANAGTLAQFPMTQLSDHVAATWAGWASRLFANWIADVAQRKRACSEREVGMRRPAVVA